MLVPQTMFCAQAGWFTKTLVPHTMLVPQTMFWAQGMTCPPMTVDGVSPVTSHQAAGGTDGLMLCARVIAPAAFSPPVP